MSEVRNDFPLRTLLLMSETVPTMVLVVGAIRSWVLLLLLYLG